MGTIKHIIQNQADFMNFHHYPVVHRVSC